MSFQMNSKMSLPQLACDVCDIEILANHLLFAKSNENYKIANVKPWLAKYHPHASIAETLDLNKVLGFENESIQWGGTGLCNIVDAVEWKGPSTLVAYKTIGVPGNAKTVRREMDLRQYLLVADGMLTIVTPYGSTINGSSDYAEGDLEGPSMAAKLPGYQGVRCPLNVAEESSKIHSVHSQARKRHKASWDVCWGLEDSPWDADGTESSQVDSEPKDSKTGNMQKNVCAVTCTEATKEKRSAIINLAHFELQRFLDKWPDYRKLHLDKFEDNQSVDDCRRKLAFLCTLNVEIYKCRHDSRMATRLLCDNAITALFIFCDLTRGLPCPSGLYIQWLAFFVPLIARESPGIAALLHACCYDMRDIVRHHCPGFKELEFALCPFDFEMMTRNGVSSIKEEQVPSSYRDLASYEVARRIRDNLITTEGSVRSFKMDDGKMCLEFRRRRHIELVTVAEKQEEFVARNAGREFIAVDEVVDTSGAPNSDSPAKHPRIGSSGSSSIDDARTLVRGSDDKETKYSEDSERLGLPSDKEASETGPETEEKKAVSFPNRTVDEALRSKKKRSWWKKVLGVFCRCG